MNLNQKKPKQQEQQEKQQFEQQEGQTIKCPGLTVEKLRGYPGLCRLSDVEAENIIDSLILFSQLTYELFMRQQAVSTNTNNSKQQGPTTIIKKKK